MSVRIVSRSEWGATPWAGPEPYLAPLGTRREFFVHYHGGPVAAGADRGVRMCREVERIHLANGWSGTGYNFMVGQDGIIHEGRGWGRVGAHCPGHNRTGLGVYVAIGGTQRPTASALAAVRALYDEACQRTGRQLTKTWHGAHYATDCCGPHLIPWVKAGMPAPSLLNKPPTPPEDDMPTAREVADALLDTPVPTGELGSDGQPLTFRWMLTRTYRATSAVQAGAIDYGQLADALALRGVSADPRAVARAVLDQLAADVADRPAT